MSGPGPVGVVLVSHSAAVAASVAELALGLLGGAPEPPAVRAAGGTADGRLGTGAELITAAVAAADRGAGVVLLADLGSSVLTVKALAQDGDLPATARLADAPFLEGAVAAVMAAGTGADLAGVLAAASEAYSYRKT
ncbi:PTS-dependent dihydroxyacetone kinase phosphotransferase subunit DhaM [Streptomyces sp. BI20]|uniref:PTS-dependent dihydroxyacetone kinase phosphotransferase subunit DhaM n=1 Tax=Streptomyces sp. BI20 TaxID=3403460 RepID=UPI003C70D4FA